jgi:outer membrane lipoprotein-sorting protein
MEGDMNHRNIEERPSRRSTHVFRGIIPLLVVLTAAGIALADLPTGEEVMEKSLEAMGGKAAFARHHNSLMKGTMSVSGVDMKMTIYAAEPNLSYTLFESEMVGKMESGCNGEIAWDLSVMQGASVKEGEELEKALFDATFNPQLHWQDRYTNVEVLAEEEVDGTACYRVALTPVVGDTITVYLDTETWLTLRTETVSNSGMGSISIVTDHLDYREVDGVKTPFTLKVLLMGAQEMITTLDSIEFNVEIPEGTFDLPAEIQELLAAKQSTGGE